MKDLGKRFNMNRIPNKPKWYLKCFTSLAAPLLLLSQNAHVKVEKEVKQLKGPFLVMSTHQSFTDFAMAAQGLKPKHCGWVISVEEFRRGDWLMYGVGGIPKRKFTHDIVTVKNMLKMLKVYKYPVTIYPEARYSLAGINERLDGALGKLVKVAKVPVVMCMINGNYLYQPQWCKEHVRKIRQEAHMYQLVSAEEVQKLTAEEIQERIEKAFVKDEYKWQIENNYHIKSKYRADKIHKILYKCPVCGKEFTMDSKETKLWCKACGAEWEMDTLSRLHGVNTDKGFEHVPDWYNWEREEVRKEVRNGTYHIEDDVIVGDYYSSKTSVIDVGEAHFTHDENGFTFKGTVDGEPFELNKSVSDMYSVHVEYNFLNRGDAFDIATEKTSYFMFLKNLDNVLTKLHFGTEELYDYYVTEKGEKPETK